MQRSIALVQCDIDRHARQAMDVRKWKLMDGAARIGSCWTSADATGQSGLQVLDSPRWLRRTAECSGRGKCCGDGVEGVRWNGKDQMEGEDRLRWKGR